MIAYIDYQKVLSGAYARNRVYGLMADYYSVSGANVRTNDFADKSLHVHKTDSLVVGLFKIINSARYQKDFEELKIISIPLSLLQNNQELKLLADISLSEIEFAESNNLLTVKIKLKDKIAYENHIQPYKSMTKLHPDYKTEEEIRHLVQDLIPQPPSAKEFDDLLKKYKITDKSLLVILKNCYQQWLKLEGKQQK